jgi:hypothetical protein
VGGFGPPNQHESFQNRFIRTTWRLGSTGPPRVGRRVRCRPANASGCALGARVVHAGPHHLVATLHRPAVGGADRRDEGQSQATARGVAVDGRRRCPVGGGIADLQQPEPAGSGDRHLDRQAAMPERVRRQLLERQQQSLHRVLGGGGRSGAVVQGGAELATEAVSSASVAGRHRPTTEDSGSLIGDVRCAYGDAGIGRPPRPEPVVRRGPLCSSGRWRVRRGPPRWSGPGTPTADGTRPSGWRLDQGTAPAGARPSPATSTHQNGRSRQRARSRTRVGSR